MTFNCLSFGKVFQVTQITTGQFQRISLMPEPSERVSLPVVKRRLLRDWTREIHPRGELCHRFGNSRSFVDQGRKVIQRLLDGERVHLTPQPFSGFERRFQVVPGDFNRQRVGNGFASLAFVFNPCWSGKRHPDSPAIDEKLDVYRVGMTGGDGHNQRLINTVHFFFCPAVLLWDRPPPQPPVIALLRRSPRRR